METSATTALVSDNIPQNSHNNPRDTSSITDNRNSQPRSSQHPRNRRNGPRSQNNKPPRGEGGQAAGDPQMNQSGSSNNQSAPRPKKPRNRPPRPREQGNAPAAHEEHVSGSTTDATTANDSRPMSRNSNAASISGSDPRSRRRRPPKVDTAQGDNQTNPPEVSQLPNKPQGRGANRRANFGARLTESDPQAQSAQSSSTKPPSERFKPKKLDGPVADDLTSRLIHTLSTPPYPDCAICFNAIRWDHATWSCSPSIPTVVADGEISQYCWTVFHLKCIKSWASKSVKDISDAWRARGEERNGDWRCPGCQGKREIVPSVYWCFCSAKADPKPPRLATPHSCGGPCTRPRESGCGHPCPLSCHPGPCPPCKVTTRLECYCPRKNILAFRCGGEKGNANAKRNLSCGEVCDRVLNCGKHNCSRICHEGSCGPCQVVETVRCWCGKENKDMLCGQGEPIDCFVEGQAPWIGRYACGSQCDRFFDCGIHKCQKTCHPPSATPAICPLSPSKITRCPCGKCAISPSPNSNFVSFDFPARTNCTSPIPTCNSTCSKPRSSCEHPCTAKCHTGPCSPCMVEIVRPCRCGATTRTIRCFEVHEGNGEEQEILCSRPCHALRACGKHECRRICCPLASLAKKGKKSVLSESGIGEERGGLHECDLVCGKTLGCGNHNCEERDHRGPCPPCLRSSFEELVCFCGRTVYEPPIPCGTKMQCRYPCPRQPPCGHPRTPHSCHDEIIPCPPCPILIARQCACGKKVVPNTKCSLERDKVSCGTVCGKLLSCGFHHCQRLCHGNDCGPCSAPCGKFRKLCLPNHHPCSTACHAPAACPETEPCQSVIVLTCPCRRIRQSVCCGRSVSSPGGKEQSSPKCTSECDIARRNARLADALGINPEGKDKIAVTYNDDLVAFARENPRFIPVVEKAFADFITSIKRTEVLPHMTPDRRKFVNDLARVYRMDTQMIDQEPHRSVQLLRRVDSRIPAPLLSAYVSSLAPPPSLGRLADLRSVKTASPSWRSSAAPVAGSSRPASRSTTHGWGPVPVNAPSSTPSAPTTRTSTPPVAGHSQPHHRAPLVAAPPSDSAPSNEPVPENWEDDV